MPLVFGSTERKKNDLKRGVQLLELTLAESILGQSNVRLLLRSGSSRTIADVSVSQSITPFPAT